VTIDLRSGASFFSGDRVTREDPRYSTMVRGLNARFAGQPDYVRCAAIARKVC
jgi:hypothetical protein